MRCSEFRTESTVFANRDLPVPLREHLENCPACRTFYARSEGIRQLVSLKRYECREAGRAEQCRRTIHQVLVEEAYRHEKETGGVEAAGLGVPGLRYVLASVFVALLFVQVFFVPTMPVIESSLPQPLGPVRMAAEMRPAFTNMGFGPGAGPGAVFQVASNPSPTGIQYGTRPSAVVGFTEP